MAEEIKNKMAEEKKTENDKAAGKNSRTLEKLEIGHTARILAVGGSGELRQHFLDMGLIPGEEITLNKFAPMGDPAEFTIQGYELTLRIADAKEIQISDDVTEKEVIKRRAAGDRHHNPHPGIGENDSYHHKEHDEGYTGLLTFALAGNQNCGKTTLFNQLTGSNQHVGNFPGVTVDKKSGSIINYPNTEITDLPGIYSLSPYTEEEIVSRTYILDSKPKGIINIVDATNIERNLYLTMQLMELDVPMVLALNMMDEMRGNGGYIHINDMEKMLGIPVVPISAVKNEGVEELARHAVHVAKYGELPGIKDFCDENDHGGAVHRAIHGIMHLIDDHAKRAGIPIRFAATKLIEGDKRVEDALDLSENEKEMIEHIVVQMEEERGLDRAAAIADMRFDFIHRVVAECVVKPAKSKERERSERIDKVLTGKYTAIPMFILIMGLVFFMTFYFPGKWLQDLVAWCVDSLTKVTDTALTNVHANPVLHSLVINGIFTGVGTVISFIPYVVLLFFFLSLLEDTGYMARVAFVMDKPLRKIGLSGRSIVPMLVGFGCSVPGVMASRTMPSERDRKLTIMLIPFMSCSAKLPIYAFFTAAFFPHQAALVMVILYAVGICVGIITAAISKNTLFKGQAVPFVMELPNYRMPGAKSTLHLMWDKTKDFLQRAFTIIFVASIVIWFLQSFTPHMAVATDSSTSILAVVAGFIAPIFRPVGFADWRITTALISGFMAKESVVSTLSVLVGADGITSILNPLSAFSLLIFCLLYTPCVAAISSIRNEQGGKYALGTVVFQCLVAYACSLIVYQVGSLFF